MGKFSGNLGRFSNFAYFLSKQLLPCPQRVYAALNKTSNGKFLPGDLPERLGCEKNLKKFNPDEIASVENIARYRNKRPNSVIFGSE
jgi:hypothetical protein